MGRIKPAWYYTRQAAEATARQNYFANRTPSANTTVNSRGASSTLYYRSLLLRNGTDPLIFSVSVYDSTLQRLAAADLGLKTALGAGEFAFPSRGSGMKPSKIFVSKGNTTPQAQTTPWNTRWVRYYDPTPGSNFSAPFSRATGTFDASDLQQQFDTLFGANGTKRALMGAENGRAWLDFEDVPVSAQS